MNAKSESSPKPAPFPVGAKLRCLKGADVYAPRVEQPDAIQQTPEHWDLLFGRGLEVEIIRVVSGTCCTNQDEATDGASIYRIGKRERRITANSSSKWQVLPAPLHVEAGDFIKEDWSDFGLILISGPVTFDVIWTGGSTSRYRHGVRHIQIVPPLKITPRVREHLLEEAKTARLERASGARVRRGMVSPSR